MGSSLLDHHVSATHVAESSCEIEKLHRTDRKPAFSPYARVLTIESRNDLSKEDQVNIWWQDDDYEVFKKETATLVKSMLNENINGWLGMKDETANRAVNPLLLALVRSQDNSPKRHLPFKALDESDIEELGPAYQKAKLADKADVEAVSWWHRYGDLACFHEAQRRQIHAKRSIRIVLNEQRRQRMTNYHDCAKIRSSYRDANNWAVRWATALASARAEEVSRELYGRILREETIASLYAMKEALTALCDNPEGDSVQFQPQHAITSVCSSQIRYRQIAIRRPLKRETDTEHLAPDLRGAVAGDSDIVGSRLEETVKPSSAAACHVNSSPNLGTSILKKVGSVHAIESKEENVQRATEKQ